MNRTQPIEFYPPFSLPASGFFLSEKQSAARLIQPSYSLSGINADEMAPLIVYIEKMLYAILHPELIGALFAQRQRNVIQKKLASLEDELPMLHINYPQEVPCTLSVTLLCPAECTHGVGHYLSNTVRQWLIPGKFLDISCVQSMHFSFLAFPNKKFLFHQVFLDIHNADDLITINETWESLKNEMRLNILSAKIKENVESVFYPVFMPRNEEEIMRNIVLLSQQLKYVTDVPQVIISFDAQTKEDLVFRVILLRVLRQNTPPIMQFFLHSSLCVSDLEVKQVSLLRKKHVKEASVFKVALNKKKFLREDFSIDLFKARQVLSSELNTLFSGIRDFNGGILSKQHEAFVTLRNLLKDTITFKDFLLENFFYSLTPPLHQSLVLPSILKDLFLLTLEAFEANYESDFVFFKAHTVEDALLIVVASIGDSLKDALFPIMNNAQISASDLSFVHVTSYNIHCLGYIYKARSATERNIFYTQVNSKVGLNRKKTG